MEQVLSSFLTMSFVDNKETSIEERPLHEVLLSKDFYTLMGEETDALPRSEVSIGARKINLR